MIKTTHSYPVAMATITFAFFMWGFLTCLNDILIPDLKSIFNLNYTQSMLVQFCFFVTYTIMSLPMSKVLSKLGYKGGVVLGFMIAAVGCLIFIPAAEIRVYGLFLLGLFVLASGIVLLQVAANPYVTLLGEAKFSARRLSLAQAFNSLGTTIAPWFGGLLILAGALKSSSVVHLSNLEFLAYQEKMSAAIQKPYLLLAVIMVVLGLIIARVKLPQFATAATSTTSQHRFWRYPHLYLGCIAIFSYVGAEVSIGSFLVNYFEQPSIGDLNPAVAASYVAYYWGAAMVGRFIGAYILGKLKPNKILIFNAIIAIILLIVTVFSHGRLAMISVLAIGLFNSVIFPTIFSLAIRGLGDYTPRASGFLCMSILGGAIVPLLQGLLADHIGIHLAFLLPIVCYMFIFYYGARGYNKNLLLL